MKRIILLASLSMIISCSQAQITKGSILLDGSINFYSDKTDKTSSNKQTYGIDLASAIGIALKDNQIYGIGLSYGYDQTKGSDYPMKEYGSRYGVDIFLRKYFPIGKKFYLYGEPELSYSYVKRRQINSSIATGYFVNKLWIAQLSLSPGISYALSKRIHLETGLPPLIDINYQMLRTDYYSTITTIPPSKESSFQIISSLSSFAIFNIGIQVLLSK
jgi:hypothetical protein